ncbi:MAG: DNA mismatch repair protein [Nitrospirales bacterium]|nr:MAG: DNA mismatch repair protein [Nitrospirales bacterium]
MQHTMNQKRAHTIEHGLARAERLFTRGTQASTSYTRWRLTIFFTAFVICLALYKSEWFHTGNLTLLGFLILFITVTYFHGRLKRQLHRLQRWQHIKRSNLARLRLDWPRIPSRNFSVQDNHPYANDLDITGPHSLLQLLDTTFSLPGQHRLDQWLLEQNEQHLRFAEWTDRQSLIKEMAQLPLLRDRMRLEARLISNQPLDGNRIHEALQHGVDVPHLAIRFFASSTLCLLTIVLGVFAAHGSIAGYWVLSFGLYVMLYFSTAGSIAPLFGRVLDLHHELEKLVAVFRLLENRRFTHHPQLAHLCTPLTTKEGRPTALTRQLARMCSGLSIKAHPLVHMLINAILPWDIGFAYRLQKTCEQAKTTLPFWMEQLATVDAASALGTFAYLNPEYVWPIREQPSSRQADTGFTAKYIGHPLINAHRRVPNSLGFRELGQVLLVTGSNMSGKSTFLRTIGINICLAQAGAPVCAQYFSWTWLRLFCCIRVTDSLAEGLSYFYAEVKRLKIVLDAVNERDGHSVLFLIDEIYKGTNNRERLGGSQAFIQALQKGYGLGLLSTHDLELAQLETNGSRVSNVHFQETVEKGKLRFDYQLRPGPCPTTNALRIMEQEGLPIPEDRE